MADRPGLIEFELDLMRAVLDQLIPRLKTMESAPLIEENTKTLPEAQGVYQLIHAGQVKYIGKTDAKDGLKSRLTRHVSKFLQRHNIVPEDVCFNAAHVYVLTAMDIETELIKHYAAEWNGSSFGSNDPGRERETTNKPADGFDAQFPINIDLPLAPITPGTKTVHEVLMWLKTALPYCFRYETTTKRPGAWKKAPHPDYLSSVLEVSTTPLTVRQLLQQIIAALPLGWQATEFPSHIILYKEDRAYTHGKPIKPLLTDVGSLTESAPAS